MVQFGERAADHHPLAGGQQLPVEQQPPGGHLVSAGVEADLDLHFALEVGASGQHETLGRDEDGLLTGLPLGAVDVLGGVADLHLSIGRGHLEAANSTQRQSPPALSPPPSGEGHEFGYLTAGRGELAAGSLAAGSSDGVGSGIGAGGLS
jgi:hypothetical protein